MQFKPERHQELLVPLQTSLYPTHSAFFCGHGETHIGGSCDYTSQGLLPFSTDSASFQVSPGSHRQQQGSQPPLQIQSSQACNDSWAESVQPSKKDVHTQECTCY